MAVSPSLGSFVECPQGTTWSWNTNMAFIRENRVSSFSPQCTGIVIVLIENITHMLVIKYSTDKKQEVL